MEEEPSSSSKDNRSLPTQPTPLTPPNTVPVTDSTIEPRAVLPSTPELTSKTKSGSKIQSPSPYPRKSGQKQSKQQYRRSPSKRRRWVNSFGGHMYVDVICPVDPAVWVMKGQLAIKYCGVEVWFPFAVCVHVAATCTHISTKGVKAKLLRR